MPVTFNSDEPDRSGFAAFRAERFHLSVVSYPLPIEAAPLLARLSLAEVNNKPGKPKAFRTERRRAAMGYSVCFISSSLLCKIVQTSKNTGRDVLSPVATCM
jgi:hypothetical protein